jgi:hypothetical protein
VLGGVLDFDAVVLDPAVADLGRYGRYVVTEDSVGACLVTIRDPLRTLSWSEGHPCFILWTLRPE